MPRHPPYALHSLIVFTSNHPNQIIFLCFPQLFVYYLKILYYLYVLYFSLFVCFSSYLNPTHLVNASDTTMQLSMCKKNFRLDRKLVGSSGLEPPTSRLSGVCSNQLSYEPIVVEDKRVELLTSCLQGRRSSQLS